MPTICPGSKLWSVKRERIVLGCLSCEGCFPIRLWSKLKWKLKIALQIALVWFESSERNSGHELLGLQGFDASILEDTGPKAISDSQKADLAGNALPGLNYY